MTLPASIRPHRHTLHVASPQRTLTMKQAALDDRGVTDQFVLVPDQGVNAAQGVIPIVIGHILDEHGVKERTRRGKGHGVQIGRVGDTKREHLDHPRTPPRAMLLAWAESPKPINDKGAPDDGKG
jgi:hypothetical protein